MGVKKKTWHRITSIDPETGIGTCSKCGTTECKLKREGHGRTRWECRSRARARSSRVTNKMSRTHPDSEHGPYSVSYKMRRIGVTPEIVEETYNNQGKRCAICRLPMKFNHRIDHCHASNKFRGLLCHHCNTGLGSFRDSPKNLTRAIQYLSDFKSRQSSCVE